MRGKLAALAATIIVCGIGCGGHAALARVPDHAPPPKGPHAQVIDVAKVELLAKGFGFTETLHREANGSLNFLSGEGTNSNSKTVEDRMITVSVAAADATGPTSVAVHFEKIAVMADDVAQPEPLAGKDYVLSASGLGHGDGSAVSAEEAQAFTTFYQSGGLILPAQDALVGLRLEAGKQVELSAAQLTGIVLMSPPAGMKDAWLRLDHVDDGGLATCTLHADGEINDGETFASWTFDGTLVIDADTLLPASLTVAVHLGGSHGDSTTAVMGDNDESSTATFTYSPAP